MIVLDPSSVAILLDPDHRRHRLARAALERSGVPTVVPAAALDRITQVATETAGPRAARVFLRGLIDGETLLDCGDLDLPRIVELLVRYEEEPLDLALAAVVACAERHGGTVLSFDERLQPIARDGLIELLG
jgi:predicted nucleic acid-binding protein